MSWHLLAAYWGYIGGNVAAMPVCGAVAVGFGFLFRDRIGRRLAGWWAKHHGPHAIAQHRQALTEHEAATAAESQGRGGSTPFASRERLDGPPAATRPGQ